MLRGESSKTRIILRPIPPDSKVRYLVGVMATTTEYYVAISMTFSQCMVSIHVYRRAADVSWTLDGVLIRSGVMTTHVSKRRAGKAYSLLKRITVSFPLYLGVFTKMLLAQMLCQWYGAANVARESQRGESDTGSERAIPKDIADFAIWTANTRQYCCGQAVVGSV